jgi:hypothetical protein
VVLGLSNVCVVVGHNRHVGYNHDLEESLLWSCGDDDGAGAAAVDTVVESSSTCLSRQGQCWVTRLVNSAHCS